MVDQVVEPEILRSTVDALAATLAANAPLTIKATKQMIETMTTPNATVASGACQALILDVPIIEAQNQKQKGAFAGVVGQIDTHEGYGAVFAKGSPLIPDVSKAINTLESNGTISALTKKWFGYDPAKVPVLK